MIEQAKTPGQTFVEARMPMGGKALWYAMSDVDRALCERAAAAVLSAHGGDWRREWRERTRGGAVVRPSPPRGMDAAALREHCRYIRDLGVEGNYELAALRAAKAELLAALTELLAARDEYSSQASHVLAAERLDAAHSSARTTIAKHEKE